MTISTAFVGFLSYTPCRNSECGPRACAFRSKSFQSKSFRSKTQLVNAAIVPFRKFEFSANFVYIFGWVRFRFSQIWIPEPSWCFNVNRKYKKIAWFSNNRHVYELSFQSHTQLMQQSQSSSSSQILSLAWLHDHDTRELFSKTQLVNRIELVRDCFPETEASMKTASFQLLWSLKHPGFWR